MTLKKKRKRNRTIIVPKILQDISVRDHNWRAYKGATKVELQHQLTHFLPLWICPHVYLFSPLPIALPHHFPLEHSLLRIKHFGSSKSFSLVLSTVISLFPSKVHAFLASGYFIEKESCDLGNFSSPLVNIERIVCFEKGGNLFSAWPKKKKKKRVEIYVYYWGHLTSIRFSSTMCLC